MATVKLSPVANENAYQNNDGLALSGGFVFTYTAGSDSSKATTYSDSTGETPNENPIQLDSSGRLPVTMWLDEDITYHIVITDTDGTTVIKDWDDITGTVSSGGGGGVSFPLARSNVNDDSNVNIEWTNGSTNQSTRVRGTLGNGEGGGTVFMHDAYLDTDGQWHEVWSTIDNSGSDAGGFIMHIPNLEVDNFSTSSGLVTQIDVGDGLFLPNGAVGEVQLNMNSETLPATATQTASNTITYLGKVTQNILNNAYTFRGYAAGTCTASGTSTVTFNPKIGDNGNNFDANIATHSMTTAAGTSNFEYTFTFTVRNNTFAGSAEVMGSCISSDVVGISISQVNVFAPTLATSINFSNGNSFGLAVGTNSSGTTISVTNFYIEMVR